LSMPSESDMTKPCQMPKGLHHKLHVYSKKKLEKAKPHVI